METWRKTVSFAARHVKQIKKKLNNQPEISTRNKFTLVEMFGGKLSKMNGVDL